MSTIEFSRCFHKNKSIRVHSPLNVLNSPNDVEVLLTRFSVCSLKIIVRLMCEWRRTRLQRAHTKCTSVPVDARHRLPFESAVIASGSAVSFPFSFYDI